MARNKIKAIIFIFFIVICFNSFSNFHNVFELAIGSKKKELESKTNPVPYGINNLWRGLYFCGGAIHN
jgi:hypothetical protein